MNTTVRKSMYAIWDNQENDWWYGRITRGYGPVTGKQVGPVFNKPASAKLSWAAETRRWNGEVQKYVQDRFDDQTRYTLHEVTLQKLD